MCKKLFFSICAILVLASASDIGAYEYVTPPTGDFTGDGAVDFEDLKIIADDWLASGNDLAGPLLTGLVSHYRFDGDVDDSVGGNHGTEVGGPTYTAGLNNQAINLDGSDDYVDCGNDSSFNITGSITLSAVIKGTFNNGWDPVIAKGYDWKLARGTGDEAAFFCVGVGSILGSTNINDNQWHHIAGVYNGSKMLLYVDGELDASKVASGSLYVSASNVWIGGDQSSSFNGLIDDVLIYNRALSKEQIEQLGRRPTDLDTDGIVGFKDFAKLAEQWLLEPAAVSVYAQWSNGPPTGASYFPIAVWLQRPEDATLWKNAGVNLYIGLWEGPTDAQLTTLRSAGMQVIASQNSTALAWKDITLAGGCPLIVGYSHGDEPDNCQPLGEGWGPPVPTSTIQQQYSQIQANDPTRPVYLNLSQGVGNDSGTWTGQGGYIDPDVDYPQYILGSDIISFDIYPMNCGRSQTCGDAWRVALGVDRLHGYSPDGHIVWNVIETGDISRYDKPGFGIMATVEEIRAEVWMSIIHGSTGICYFIHGTSSYSDFDERALLQPEHADRLAAVTAINNQIHELAPVLNSPTLQGAAAVYTITGSTPVDFIVKRYGGATYLFAAGMRDSTTVKLFVLPGLADTTIEVLGEDRELSLLYGQFQDTFAGYEAHLYKINAVP